MARFSLYLPTVNFVFKSLTTGFTFSSGCIALLYSAQDYWVFCLFPNLQLFFFFATTILQAYSFHESKENHWLKSRLWGQKHKRTHHNTKKLWLISTTAKLSPAYWQYKWCTFQFFFTFFFLESESVPGDYLWMYDPAVLTGCTYGLHACPEWMQTPLNLWGPLYNNWGNVSSIEYCKARWPDCLEMCTIFF